MKPLIPIAAAVVVATLSGCVYVNGEHVSTGDWRDEQRHNREEISSLKLGVSTGEVINRLGTPTDSEAFTDDGIEMRVLFYRTTHQHSDGETTRDETTPLVFRDNQLIGWGDKVYRDLRP